MKEDAWTPNRRKVVTKLLGECNEQSSHGVSSKHFRKRNYSDIDDIEYLVRQGFILDRNFQYSVNTLCLLQIESTLASKIRKSANSLWRTFREIYLSSEDDNVVLSTVIRDAGLSMDEAQRALHYMLQTSWYAGHATPVDGQIESVVIGERVLEYETFTAYVAQLYKERAEVPLLFAPSRFPAEAIQDPKVLQLLADTNLPIWQSELPEGVSELLRETLRAKEQGWNRLTAMGIRTLFDMVSTDALSSDAGTFKAKLDEMVREEHIVPMQKENLNAMVEAGNAAAHRGFNPTPEMVHTMWGIALNALESYFVLRPKADRLRSDTPKRAPRVKLQKASNIP